MRGISVGVVLGIACAAVLIRGGDVRAQPCACNSDVTTLGGSGVNAVDLAVVRDCINGTCGQCNNSSCDVDCDSDVDYYDAGVVACAFEGQSNCCSEPAGVCVDTQNGPPGPQCVITTDNYCNVFDGTWNPPGALCINNALVPTVSTWGLLALALGTLIAATLILQRRRAVSSVASH